MADECYDSFRTVVTEFESRKHPRPQRENVLFKKSKEMLNEICVVKKEIQRRNNIVATRLLFDAWNAHVFLVKKSIHILQS